MFSNSSSQSLRNISSGPVGTRVALGASADWKSCLEVICDPGCAETASLSQSCLHYHSFVPRACTCLRTSPEGHKLGSSDEIGGEMWCPEEQAELTAAPAIRGIDVCFSSKPGAEFGWFILDAELDLQPHTIKVLCAVPEGAHPAAGCCGSRFR